MDAALYILIQFKGSFPFSSCNAIPSAVQLFPTREQIELTAIG